MTKERRTNKWIYMVTGLLAGTVFWGFLLATCTHGGKPVGSGPKVKSADATKPGETKKENSRAQALRRGGVRESFSEVTEKVIPSVVNVHPTRVVKGRRGMGPFADDPLLKRFFGDRLPKGRAPERRMRGLGSGVIISKDGYIVTNNHVVDKATDIRVSLHDKREFKAEVVGTDPRTDLALLKIDADDLQPAELGESVKLKVGDVVLAVGNPFGVGGTVTMGIVSAVGRTGMGITDYEDFIQTDAAINPGNSGGALVNLDGEVVGIPTAILSRTGGYQGIGFAIPSDMVKPIAASLRKEGRVSRSYLGVMIQQINPSMAKALGIKPGRGVLVSDVQPGTPAEKAGLQSGDVILELNGTPVKSFHRFRNKISAFGTGTTVELKVLREDKKMEISVTLDELPQEKRVAKRPGARPDDRTSRSMKGSKGTLLEGVKITTLTPSRRKILKLPAKYKGVIVESVSTGSPAILAGLKPGDVILAVNRMPTHTLDAVKKAVKKDSDRVFMKIWRGGTTLYLGWTLK